MEQRSYSYSREEQTRYTFISSGKEEIIKVIAFSTTRYQNILNMGFGDLMPDGNIDDKRNSNNGDMVRVLATVIQILKTFLSNYPEYKIFFKGSTDRRTSFYQRIISIHYNELTLEYKITALIKNENGYIEVNFDKNATISYWAFYVKKII